MADCKEIAGTYQPEAAKKNQHENEQSSDEDEEE
jgi:hypothetical protein